MASSGIRRAKVLCYQFWNEFFSTFIADVVKPRRYAVEICGSADKYKENLILAKKLLFPREQEYMNL